MFAQSLAVRAIRGAPVRSAAQRAVRGFCSSSSSDDLLSSPREAMEYDVVIVGAGPAGLSAAIRLKQLEAETGKEISVCVVEKAAEVGAHILSGNVFEPRALNELIPDWKEEEALGEDPTEAKDDNFVVCTSESKGYSLPGFLIPPSLHNDGNYIISLSKLVRWLGGKAEELGVEIYPGFPAGDVLYDDNGAVVGIATADMGIGKDGHPKDTFMRGMELRAKQTLFAEGARGSCSEEVIKNFDLRKDCDMQSYGLGIKEVWEIPEENLKPGTIQHTIGWPLDMKTYGGSFLYHMKPNFILIGMVVGLDYQNPYLSPYEEFQRFKHHPDVKKHLEGGECVAYGARVINEGGFQAIPKLTFPGGALIGCSAGFLNVPKIKGTHTAMKSGMVAADSVFEELTAEDAPEEIVEVSQYQTNMENSWVWEELKAVRNYAPSFKWGTLAGVAYSGLSGFVLRGKEPWTFSKHGKDRDCDATKKAAECKEIEYPKPDGVLSFDILTNLARSGTNHEGDQPAHLRIKPDLKDIPNEVSITEYAGPEQRFCPAKVYEYQPNAETNKMELVINAQNCVHCKCCSIKMPEEYIKWTVPEGGGGPAYEVM
uniref:Electron transfer flavoprotein-ubiquinone oxidoreductase n=1 Tax=Aplanochytrium stocchinoi TaxID=215587 RepID=A0A7S3PR61_9STRA|mmetsp:Transcript_2681/g.3619  ORF Transcript_2681/g.3619 Transcript_2681/m.3619 type:complete len:597 (+) Transcript_2681:111-1901(+)|eukprot:CAMPEP_0204838982 /NCGR_PEP_ID=MMETSP1346-20131115/32651_1 /ASSEMBLY_ACC=CAM_ASM_000771 /TAXON_ID=215587 /ORGANISM="Aplanochytrium stocchinoi, Strain GSBS06" /LENGTH=596 /DNA_ID=CAMNT_0051975387 /DNA_START=68 /DNA_END=1858 /DNA_ORIENTATION=+